MNAPVSLAADVRIAGEVVTAIQAAGIADDDPDFIALVAAESDLPKRLERMIRRARFMETHAKALKDMIEEMRERKSRFESQAEKLRHIATWAMAEAGLPRLDCPDFTASLSRGRPQVVVPDPEAVPLEFCRVKKEPDKVRIRELLENGMAPEWAHLGNQQHQISVRTR